MQPGFQVGSYAVFDRIASGGMANVHLGRLLGPAHSHPVVAVKRLRPEFAAESEFIAQLLDEAALTRRIHHPGVVPVLELVQSRSEVCLISEFIYGETLLVLSATLLRRPARTPLPIVSAIVRDILAALHAAHDATDSQGAPLRIVHRDVSPHNVIVGVDGVSRVIDFGVAKAASRLQTTMEGHVKGKLRYMAPEQLLGAPVDRRSDLFSAGIILWEMLAKRRLFDAHDAQAISEAVVNAEVPPIGTLCPGVPEAVSRVVHRALALHPQDRFSSCREMSVALADAVAPASPAAVAKWLLGLAAATIGVCRRRALEIEAYELPAEGRISLSVDDEPTITEDFPPFSEDPDDDQPTLEMPNPRWMPRS